LEEFHAATVAEVFEAQKKVELTSQELEVQKSKRLAARNEMIGIAQVNISVRI
jgi:hypothetical protein